MSDTPDTPPTAQPDDKDWTWVLERACPDCGASVGALSISEVSAANHANTLAWAAVLEQEENWLRVRPEPQVWSPLEYACHVRDVYRLFAQRLDLMLSEENPEFANWDPNVTQVAERYDLSVPEQVRTELLDAGTTIANKFGQLSTDQLNRTGRRSDGATFTIETFARYEIHDPVHHLWDVTGELSTLGH